MGFTTGFGLHSQTTRLCECVPWSDDDSADGVLTLYGPAFQLNWDERDAGDASIDYKSTAKGCRFSSWALPGSLAVTRGILVSFFSSA